ncbi:Pyridoxine/pyridoxamine 5'-phosphate oxidase [Bienertia sinuspersici]
MLPRGRKEGGTLPHPMDNLLSWNVRGANQMEKKRAIRHLIAQQKVGLVALLETKVKASNLGVLYKTVFDGWCFTSNISKHYNGRIAVAWNPMAFTVGVLDMTEQYIHCVIKPKMEEAWNWKGEGTVMYKLTRKLKQVKTSMKELKKKGFYDIQAEVNMAYQVLL